MRGGEWGSLADPNNRDEILNAVRNSLRDPKIPAREEMEYFSKTRFRGRVWKALEQAGHLR